MGKRDERFEPVTDDICWREFAFVRKNFPSGVKERVESQD